MKVPAHRASPKKYISVGMIGLGLISRMHFEAYANRPDVRIEALSDNNHPLLAQKGKYLGVRALYPDYTAMLENPDIDVVDVMTPHSHHAECVVGALRQGKTVICEKPLATTLKDIDAILHAATVAKKNVYVKQYLRYSLAYRKAQQLLSDNVIGKPYFIQCTFTSNSIADFANPHTWKGNKKEAGGGIFMDVGVHMLDLLQVMFGQPVAVYAQTRKILATLPEKGEDFATALVEFPHNLMIHIACTENDTGYRFRWEVRMYGTEGVMNIIDEGKQAKILQVVKENAVVYEFTEDQWWEQSNIRALNDIIERIIHNQVPAVSLGHVRSVVATIVASYASASSGRTMRLD